MPLDEGQVNDIFAHMERVEALLEQIAEGVGGSARSGGGATAAGGGGRSGGGGFGVGVALNPVGAAGLAVASFAARAVGGDQAAAATARFVEIQLRQIPVLQSLKQSIDAFAAKITAIDKVKDIAAQAERLGKPLSVGTIKRLGAVEELGTKLEEAGRDRVEKVLGDGGLNQVVEAFAEQLNTKVIAPLEQMAKALMNVQGARATQRSR